MSFGIFRRFERLYSLRKIKKYPTTQRHVQEDLNFSNTAGRSSVLARTQWAHTFFFSHSQTTKPLPLSHAHTVGEFDGNRSIQFLFRNVNITEI